MAWFCTCAYVAALTVCRMFGGALSGAEYCATASAILPAAIFGASILRPKDEHKSPLIRSIGSGAAVVIFSHLIFSGIIGISGGSVVGAFGMFVLGIIFGGWVTVPAGCAAAAILHLFRAWRIGPKGCAVHGYANSANP